MDFKTEYLKLKSLNLLDDEICKLLFMSRSTLYHWKKKHGIKTKVVRKNTLGLTGEHFQLADQNGIDHETLLKRVRLYNFTIERAITQEKKERNYAV